MPRAGNQPPLDNLPLAIEPHIYGSIADDLTKQSYSIQADCFPLLLAQDLRISLLALNRDNFIQAGIGRGAAKVQNHDIRKDKISWIEDDCPSHHQWLAWTTGLLKHINLELFMGLNSFESHFATYQSGDYYGKHMDSFKGAHNRKLSIVLYLNNDWLKIDAGEICLFTGKDHLIKTLIAPKMGTIAVFLSEEIPHEVLLTTKERFSIAGWYSINMPHVS